jgi:hypothetical protein
MPAILVEIACFSNEDEVIVVDKRGIIAKISPWLWCRAFRSYAASLNAPNRKGS